MTIAMTKEVKDLVNRLVENHALAQKSQSSAVPHILNVARDISQLRKRVRTGWQEICEEKLGLDPRVAQRYRKIGDAWPNEQTPGSDVVAKLPTSLHKLEALCELTQDQLRQLVEDEPNLRNLERPEVLKLVKEITGTDEDDQREAERRSDVKFSAYLRRWEGLADRAVADLLKVKEADRPRVAERLDSMLVELREAMETALAPAEEGAGPEETGEPEASGEVGAQEVAQEPGKEAESPAAQPAGQVELSAPKPAAAKATPATAPRRAGQKAA
jgi:hypothetical protein